MKEQPLIQRVLLNNDQRAFGELVKLHQSQLRYSIRQWTRWDFALADDLAQEVFLKVYRKLHQYRATAKFSTWIYRIAYNTYLNHMSKPRISTQPIEAASELAGDVGVQQIRMAHDIEQALSQLSEPQRVAIHLCMQREFSHSEAAEIMGIPIGTVKTHVNRGKIQLQLLMADYEEAADV